MAPTYTVLIPPTRVTDDEANFVTNYRRANRVTLSETLRRCVNALRDNGRNFKHAPYGSSTSQVGPFLVDVETNHFLNELAHDLDTSRCQIIRSAIDCMIKQEAKA